MVKFDRNATVLSISHGDFDGVASQIVLGNVFKNIEYVVAEFYTIDQKMSAVDYNAYDYVFITDIHPTEVKYLDLADNIVLIDHHASAFHDQSKNRFVISDKKKCAAYLVKWFFEKMYGKEINLSHLNNLIRYANDYDTWQKKYAKSTFINETYKSLHDVVEFRNRFMSGDTRLTEEEISFIRERKALFVKTYKEIEVFEFDDVNGCVCICENFPNEIADTLIKKDGYRIVIIRNPSKGRSSVRHNVEGLDVGALLDKLQYGGGHPYAAGFFERDESMFYKKVVAIQEELILCGIGGVLL